VAVTVGDVPGIPVRIAIVTPSGPVVPPEVTKPAVVVNVTATRLTRYSPASRTVATIEAVGGLVVLTIVEVSEMVAGVPVTDVPVDEIGFSEQWTLAKATMRTADRMYRPLLTARDRRNRTFLGLSDITIRLSGNGTRRRNSQAREQLAPQTQFAGSR
jgi:hypothetical protein